MLESSSAELTVEVLSAAALRLALLVGLFLEIKLLVSSLLNYQFVIERAINGLKLRSAQSTVRRKVAKIIALALLYKAPSIWGHTAAAVLIIDSVFAWNDLQYFTRVLRNHENEL